MIISKENVVDCRLEERVKFIVGASFNEQGLIEFAKKILLLDQNSNEFCNEFTNFSTALTDCSPTNIVQLKSIDFDKFLLRLIQNRQSPIVFQQALNCIYIWISKFQDENSFFFSTEFALLISSLALSPEQNDTFSCLLLFAILKTIFNYAPQCIPVLVKTGIVKGLVVFFFNCSEPRIQKEVLCTLYFLIKTKQIPLEFITDIIPIFTNVLSNAYNSNFDLIFALASAFADYSEEHCFLLIDCLPLEHLFLSFSNFSNDGQANFLRLLISIFDHSSLKNLSIIIGYFKWDVILSFVNRPDNILIKEYFVKFLSSAFQKCPALINSAYEINVLRFLLTWTENEQYSISTVAFIALLQAFNYGIAAVKLFLLNSGILLQMMCHLDTDSKILTKEICKTILFLYDYANANGNEALCKSIDVQSVTEILETIDIENEQPYDLLEIVKTSLEDIHHSHSWK